LFKPSRAQIMSPHILDARHGWTYMVYDSMFALLSFDLVFVGFFFFFFFFCLKKQLKKTSQNK
jgi:hypothetical protein